MVEPNQLDESKHNTARRSDYSTRKKDLEAETKKADCDDPPTDSSEPQAEAGVKDVFKVAKKKSSTP